MGVVIETPAPTLAAPSTAWLSRFGFGAVLVASVTVVALDVHTAMRTPEHLRRTISEYGLGSEQWVFGIGVVLLALGSLAVLVAAVRLSIATATSVGSIALGLWAAGLVAVVAAPKQDWSNDATLGLSGAIHRVGSATAFVALPVAVLAISWPWIRRSGWVRATFVLGLLSVAALLPIVYALVVGATTPTPWYRVVTLGYVERVLVVVEVLSLAALGWWTVAASAGGRIGRGTGWERDASVRV